MKKFLLSLLLFSSISTISEEIVFITPKGTKYHATRDCRTLNRSKVVEEIPLSEVGDRLPCKVCH